MVNEMERLCAVETFVPFFGSRLVIVVGLQDLGLAV